jgi:hypothetical protein
MRGCAPVADHVGSGKVPGGSAAVKEAQLVRNYTIVYPEGRREVRTAAVVPGPGARLSFGIVSYVSRRNREEPTVYLDPAERIPQRVVTFVVDGSEYPLSLGETARLGDLLREISQDSVGPPTTAAIGIERLLEETTGEETTGEIGTTDFFESEQVAIGSAIAAWPTQLGSDGLPDRVANLLTALRDNAQDPPFEDEPSAA